MKTVYVYVLDTLADWEVGHVLAELNSGRFFKKDAPELRVLRVGATLDAVTSMGGWELRPQVTLTDVAADKDTVLLLPGADTWSDPAHAAVIGEAGDILAAGGTVAAICGATVALAGTGMLDERPHTSNGAGFLEMMVRAYGGTAWFVDAASVSADGLITAGATGALAWARDILEALGVMDPAALEHWFEYFSTGDAGHFFALMQAA